jgi:glycosyltransferase involved in cell wall biosynthesis
VTGGYPPGESPRRAMQLVANLERGGAQEVVRTLAANLRATGWECVVVSFRDGPLREALEADGVTVEVLPHRRLSLLRHPPRALGELRRMRAALIDAIRRHRPLVLQTHLLRSLDFVAWSVAGLRPLRGLVWTIHNANVELRADQLPDHRWSLHAKRLAYRVLYRAGSRHRAVFVAVSAAVADSISQRFGVRRARIVTIPNGIDVDRYPADVDRDALRASLGMGTTDTVVISVAKLYRQKGHLVLVEAMRRVMAGRGHVHLVLAGDGPERSAVEQAVQASGHAERIHLLGERGDVGALLGASDVFVLASLWEGLPMALLEAMASGLPVVATTVAGSSQVVEDRRSGLLVPPGDAGALAAAIGEICDDQELAERLRVGGRERVEDGFSAAAQARAHAELYARLAAGRASAT